MNKANMPKILAGVGIAAGIIYGMKKREKMSKTLLIAGIVGVAGYAVGTWINKN